jgi:hypothetical protein
MTTLLMPFGDDIWIADGTVVSVAGFRYPTRCAVVRLHDNGLLIWSPVTLCETLRAEIGALGDVTHLIAPNTLHHLFIAEWQLAYPKSQLYAAPGLSQKRSDLHIESDLTDVPEPAWIDQMEQVVVMNKLTTEVVFFHKPSKTVIFTDILQQFPKGWHVGWRKIIAELDLMVGQTANVPRKFRLGFTPRKAARETVRKILDWPAERVLMAHGTPVETNGQDMLRKAFDWLMK